MKKGGHISEEHKAKLLAAAAEGRERRKMKDAAEKVALMFCFTPPLRGSIATPQSNTESSRSVERPSDAPISNGHLDLSDPFKWQMKIRMHVQQMDYHDAEAWMEAFRVSFQVASVSVRDLVLRNATSRCFICGKPFPEGRPAGEAGYYDGDRNYIKVYCCHNAEYSSLLLKCQEKEQAVASWQQRADKAAQQAMIDARSAARKSMPA